MNKVKGACKKLKKALIKVPFLIYFDPKKLIQLKINILGKEILGIIL